MSKTINQVLLFGNCGKDPEVRTLDNGVKVATFSLATSTGGYTNKDGKEVPEITSWHNIVCWRGLAEIAEKYIKKGSKVLIQGSISYRSYEKEGQTHYVTDIQATDISLAGSNNNASSGAPAITENDMPAYIPEPKDDLPF